MLLPPDRDALAVVERGLGSAGARGRRVVVVGAGMAGLVAARELLRAGHDPVVLEARPRVGGRIFTLREPFLPGLSAEAGAMRIPTAHALTMAYVRAFGLATAPFDGDDPRAWVCVRGRRQRRDALDDPWLGFRVRDDERRLTPERRFCALLEPLAEEVRAQAPGAAREEALAELLQRYGDLSLGGFLADAGWSEPAIEAWGILSQMEALTNAAFVAFLVDYLEADAPRVRLEGGMDALPRAFLPELSERVRFGARVTAIEQTERGVVVRYRTGAGRFAVEAERAIVTIPFPVLRHIEVTPALSPGKHRAIRQMRYASVGKIFFQVRRRFWEDEGIRGGRTITDLPIRSVYYAPGGHRGERGVVLASYTWSQDAERWAALSPADRLEQALENLAEIHPAVLDAYECGASHMWHHDPHAGGAFVMPEPGRQESLRREAARPEGRLHFAGEHTAFRHRWIEGAVASGLRAAGEVHRAPPDEAP